MKSFVKNILDIKISRGDNYLLYDETGKGYLDFTAGIFAANIGHCNPYVTEAIKRQAGELIHSYTYQTEIREKYLDRLCKFTGYEAAALFSAGTEATEAAWKVMRIFTGKPAIYGLPAAFHGKTFGAQIMSGKMADHRYAQPLPHTCGLIMEPYEALFAKLHHDQVIKRWHGLHEVGPWMLLCIDEIQAGFGRTGKLFGYEHYPTLEPDLVCVGKGLGNGFPVSALLGSKKLVNEKIYDLSSTHGGNPLACAVGLAVLEYYEDHNTIEEAERKGKLFQELLKKLPCQTSGVGMVGALVLGGDDSDRFIKAAADMGLLVVHTGGSTVKLGPPLTITDEALTTGFELITEVLGNDFQD